MASPQAYDFFFSTNKVNVFPVDGNYSTAAIAKAVGSSDAEVWFDMKGFSGIHVTACGINVNSTGVEQITLVGDSDADGGSGSNVIIKASTDDAATAEGGWITVECSAEQMAQEGADNSVNLRYIGIKLENENTADETVIHVVRTGGRAFSGLTAPSATGLLPAA